jgi:peroxiredoxin
MRLFHRHQPAFASSGLRVVGINVDGINDDSLRDSAAVRSFVDKERLSFPTLIATADVAGVYNIVYRYLFDRRRDLDLPTSFLIDQDGMIVKVCQGMLNSERLATILREDLRSAPRTRADRIRKALPMGGTLYDETFQRNDFTYGVAFFQHGYLDQAEASFRRSSPPSTGRPEAHYNLGTLYLRRNAILRRANTSSRQ